MEPGRQADRLPRRRGSEVLGLQPEQARRDCRHRRPAADPRGVARSAGRVSRNGRRTARRWRSSSSTIARSTRRAIAAQRRRQGRAARDGEERRRAICRPAARRRIRGAVATDTEPPEVAALENGRLRRLSHQNDEWLSKVLLGTTEEFTSTSKDGTDVHGLIVKPADLSRRAEVSDAAAHPWRPERAGRARVQLRARALRGQRLRRRRGELSRQQRARQRLPEGDLRGLGRQGSRRPARRDGPRPEDGLADPDRLGIGGWSYGGILTDYTIATDGRFKAATSGAGSALQLSMYGVDQYITQYETGDRAALEGAGPVDQDLVSVLPRGPDQDADAVPRWARRTSTCRWSGASRCTRRSRASASTRSW